MSENQFERHKPVEKHSRNQADHIGPLLSERHSPDAKSKLVSDRENALFCGRRGFSFAEFGDIYGTRNTIAQTVPGEIKAVVDGDVERLTQQKKIDDRGNWKFRRHPGDVAGAVKESLWNTFMPSKGKVANNNYEFVYQFLTGTGKDIQEHTDRHDPVLIDFVKSPGAEAIRDQYLKLGNPAYTDKLGFGTWDAFKKTVVPEVSQGTSPISIRFKDLNSVAAQVGGFGNPPIEYPWAKATATRYNSEGHREPEGSFVQYQVINVAGTHSFVLHGVRDRSLGVQGPGRTVIQVFRWTESI